MKGEFVAETKTLEYKTKRRLEFINITKDVEDFVKESCVETGNVVVQTHHTTCGVWMNEDEKNLIGQSEGGDLRKVLDGFANPDGEYGHNDIKDSRNPNGKRDTHLCEPDEKGVCHECINGHAHAQGLIIKSSISLIVKKGKLLRGKWQEIMIVELDHDREREVTFLVQGVGKVYN
ncbi:MAG: YjbQ family protein [archaeon]